MVEVVETGAARRTTALASPRPCACAVAMAPSSSSQSEITWPQRRLHLNLMGSGVNFMAVDFPQAYRLTVHILAAVAEHEGEMISKRINDVLTGAKAGARGSKAPGAKFTSWPVLPCDPPRPSAGLRTLGQSWRISGRMVLSSSGRSRVTLNERHIKIACGGEGTTIQRMRVLNRTEVGLRQRSAITLTFSSGYGAVLTEVGVRSSPCEVAPEAAGRGPYLR
jgi:hypothetical protein